MFDPIFIRSESITCNLLKSKISNYIYRIIYISSLNSLGIQNPASV